MALQGVGVGFDVQYDSAIAAFGGRLGDSWQRAVMSELLRRGALLGPRYKRALQATYDAQGGGVASGRLRESFGAVPGSGGTADLSNILVYGHVLAPPPYAGAVAGGVLPGKGPPVDALLQWMAEVGKDIGNEQEQRAAARRISKAIRRRGIRALRTVSQFYNSGESAALRKELIAGVADGSLKAIIQWGAGPTLQLGQSIIGPNTGTTPGSLIAARISGRPVVGVITESRRIRGPGGQFAGSVPGAN